MSNIVFTVLAFLLGGFGGSCVGAFLALRSAPQAMGVYDYHYCSCDRDLAETLEHINAQGYQLISVTYQDGMHTVFFRRPADK